MTTEPAEFRRLFGMRLRTLQERRSQRHEQMAAQAGVSLTTLLRWQSGLYVPRLSEFAGLCARLKVAPLELIGETSGLDE